MKEKTRERIFLNSNDVTLQTLLKSISENVRSLKINYRGFPGGWVVNLPANTGDMGSTLIWEDPTCCRATKPVQHQLLILCSRARGRQPLKPACPEPVLCKGSHCKGSLWTTAQEKSQREKSPRTNKDHAQPKWINKSII